MERLNLVSRGDDRELDAIRDAMMRFDNVSGLDEVLAVLETHAGRGTRTALLDAIGHSSSRGFLVLGTWVIDDSPQTAASFSQLLCPVLDLLGVRRIRLLGCSTATTEGGRNAMRRIARVTGRDVLGTTRYISSHDYGPAGFTSVHTLIDADGVRLRC